MNRLLMLCFALAAMSGQSATAQSLETLFTSAAQRAALDLNRERAAAGYLVDQAPIVVEPAPVVIQAPERSRPAETVFTLGGTMVRSNGQFQVWINGRSYDADSLPAFMEMLQPHASGRLRISDPDSENSWTLSPGQTLDMVTGEVREAYQQPVPAGTSAVGAAP